MLYPEFTELVALKKKAGSLPLSSHKHVSSTTSGGYASPFRGQGLEFEEVRAYTPGDDIRNIDWRVTARLSSPHTKVFKEDRERSIILCVDVNATMRFGTRGTFKSIQAAKIAALLGWQATLSHDKLGACLFGDVPRGIHFLTPQRSRKALWALFKDLSKKDINEQAPFIPLEEALRYLVPTAPTGALIYIISDGVTASKALELYLRTLHKRCEVVFIPIDDPADQMLPSLGPLVCVGPHEKAFINTTNSKGRNAYAAEWQQTRQELLLLLKKLNIRMIPIATDADASTDLLFGLKKISKRATSR